MKPLNLKAKCPARLSSAATIAGLERALPRPGSVTREFSQIIPTNTIKHNKQNLAKTMKTSKSPQCRPLRHGSLLKPWGLLWLVACALSAGCLPATAQSYKLSPAWQATTNTLPGADISAANGNNRGLAYSVASNIVFVASKTVPTIDALNGSTGAYLGRVNTNGMTPVGFGIDAIAVADDGVLYSGNLTSTPMTLNVWMWTNWTTPPTLVFSGDPTMGLISSPSKRLGDCMTITGSGLNTQIIFPVTFNSAYTGTSNLVMLSTANLTSFTPTLLIVTNISVVTSVETGYGSPVAQGITFFTNNTFFYDPNLGATTYLVQYPANFASLTSPVLVGAILTNAFSAQAEYMNYNAASGLLATEGPMPGGTSGKVSVSLYQVPPMTGLGSPLATTNFSAANSMNSDIGVVALGGAGKTNYIYALACNNGVIAESITYTPAATPPSITSFTLPGAPGNGLLFPSTNAVTFNVLATGTQPLYYQWALNSVSNVLTATNIAGATNQAYVPLASSTGWYDVTVSNAAGVVTSTVVRLAVTAPVTSPAYFSPLWDLQAGSRPYLSTSDSASRGMAFDTNTMTVLVADHSAVTFGIYVLDAASGNDLFALDTVGVTYSGDAFDLDQVGVADDGVVYACNMSGPGAAHGSFIVYSWPSVSASAAPSYAYLPGDPSAPGIRDRFGDTMAVRGAGTNTQILLGTWNTSGGPATNAALLTTTASDGTGFSSIPLIITNATGIPANFSSLGICFGAGNTFWAKSLNQDLYEIAFDPVSGNCNVLLALPAGSAPFNAPFASMTGISMDPVANILSGTETGDVPNDLAVYQIYGTPTNALPVPPLLLQQELFQPNVNSASIQGGGTTVTKAGYIFGLSINNGLVGMTYTSPPSLSLPAYNVTAITNNLAGASNPTGTGIIVSWQSYAGVSYEVQYTTNLVSGIWTSLGAPTPATGNTTSFTDSNPTDGARFYRVVSP